MNKTEPELTIQWSELTASDTAYRAQNPLSTSFQRSLRAFIPQIMLTAYDCESGLARQHIIVFSGFDENPAHAIQDD